MTRPEPPTAPRWRGLILACVAALAGCAADRPVPALRPAEARALMAALLPVNTADKAGWATDTYAAFAAMGIAPTRENICAVFAVTEQESTFRADPVVPNLAAITWAEIDRRAERAGVPALLVHAALRLASPNGKSYSERIDAARTERELSLIFDDFIGMAPMGRRLFSGWNPVRTGGPMQVSIAFAERHAAAKTYPYPVDGSIRDEVFTRRGGMYFGIAHLLDYPAPYDRPLYRFADFNAGHYASRNAAFQNALAIASGIPLALDGDLVRHDADDDQPGSTERAARTLAKRLDLDHADIRQALEKGSQQDFERTALYRRVFALAAEARGRPLPSALVPRIALKSPKITRNLTTAWFAERVNARHRRCLARAGAAQRVD
jgi:hypothetical protein